MPTQRYPEMSNASGVQLRQIFSPPQDTTLKPVLEEILSELRAIRQHMDRAKWLGPEGEALIKRLRVGDGE